MQNQNKINLNVYKKKAMIFIAPVYLDLPQNRTEYVLDSQNKFKFALSKKCTKSIITKDQIAYKECEFSLTEKDLHESVNYLASQSFNEIWKNENDDYWNSYL